MSDVTRILLQIESGNPTAAEHLLPLVYDELRKLAAARMSRERPDHSLDGRGAANGAGQLTGPPSYIAPTFPSYQNHCNMRTLRRLVSHFKKKRTLVDQLSAEPTEMTTKR